MEAAIRCAPGTSSDKQHYLIVDVAGGHITLHEATLNQGNELKPTRLARYDKIPAFTAFDWHRKDRSILALGLANGDSSIITVNAQKGIIKPVNLLRNTSTRKTNSISFSIGNSFAVAHDRARHEPCLSVYDVEGKQEPVVTFCNGEPVSSVRFSARHPSEIVASVNRSTLKLFDVRSGSVETSGEMPSVNTRSINNISMDPLDDNYFASGGAAGDPTVTIWDKRTFSSAKTPSAVTKPLFEIYPAINTAQSASIWSIRFSPQQRGMFGVLSSGGNVRMYNVREHYTPRMHRFGGHEHAQNATAWPDARYVARSHNLYRALDGKRQSSAEQARVTAFDWHSDPPESQSILALHTTRTVTSCYVPDAPFVSMTAKSELAVDGRSHLILGPTAKNSDMQSDEEDRAQHRRSSGRNIRLNAEPKALNADALEGLQQPDAAVRRTQSWLHGEMSAQPAREASKQDVTAALALIDLHRQRCQAGYRFDVGRNKSITRDDPVLQRLWMIVARLEDLVANKGMVTDDLDLAYLGVSDIWHARLGASKNRVLRNGKVTEELFNASLERLVEMHRLPKLEGLADSSLTKRLLGLEICGWCFSREGVEGKCTNLIEQRQYYRAIAVAAIQDHRDLSLNMLRNLTRSKLIADAGLGALLAARDLNQDQRDMCRWMEEDAKDPYLRTLLQWLAEDSWHAIANNTQLHLSDRLSTALRYLDDSELTAFIDSATSTAIDAGEVSGLLLTGLNDMSMSLLQSFLARTSDLQTVVLAASFSNPLYVDDMRFLLWRDTYLDLLQSWRLFIHRTRYTAEHTRRSVRRDGVSLLGPQPRQISLRCIHCNAGLAPAPTSASTKPPGGGGGVITFDTTPPPVRYALSTGSGNAAARRVAENSGTACPHCGRHLPRCAICMQWLGTPERSSIATNDSSHLVSGARARDAATKTAVATGIVAVPLAEDARFDSSSGLDSDRRGQGIETPSHRQQRRGNADKSLDVALSRFVTFCAACGHGLHAHHARQWFAKHGMCPVPDCACLCGTRR